MEMQENESIERIREGLKKAAACAKQLGRAQKSKDWLFLGKQLTVLLESAEQLFSSGVMSDTDAMAMTEIIIDKLSLQHPATVQ